MLAGFTSAELAAARADAESLMTDACTVTRAGDEPVLNEDTLEYETGTDPVHAGKCRVQAGTSLATEREAGDRLTFGTRVVVSLPLTVDGVESGDLVTVTASAYTPQLVGRAYRVRSVVTKSHPTALRLECEEA